MNLSFSMLPSASLLRTLHHPVKEAFLRLSTSPRLNAYKITETVEGDTTVVKMEEVKSEAKIQSATAECSLCTCSVPVKVSYKDVLILEQFMREDGTVLPAQLTGLCRKQQLHVERCVMQAHWAGLFPDRTIPEFDRAGYKRFNRYWNDSMDMYRLQEKKLPGTWFYIKRYQTKNTRVQKK
ncbi:hypothetical protein PFISCL1PPCAC_10421 [Pristionchus fissidentatus]|uniref:Uncharacterized protein n=1 Tax=Pristionchus fissidentatus TaxID=1538716 RepID=A0AAV5VL70_9BILA|nr:hypothetical protein PFISCL1PPCAC_10421 [Pristionchus fissidentatus]